MYVHDTHSRTLGEGKSLRDDDRDIVFEFLGSAAYDSVQAFRLTRRGTEIPVQANLTRAPGTPVTIVYTNLIVTGTITLDKYGVRAHDFESAEEEQQAALIAAECLVVFGSYYNGLTTDVTYQVELNGRNLSLNEFAYDAFSND